MGYDRIVYIRYHFSCGLDRKDACWLSFTPLTGHIYSLFFSNVWILIIYEYVYIYIEAFPERTMHDFFKSKLDKCFLTVFLVFFFPSGLWKEIEAADNMVFGSGGALLQKLNRDTFKCQKSQSGSGEFFFMGIWGVGNLLRPPPQPPPPNK